LIYQNWVLSILSVGMDYPTFTALQGSNFAALATLAGVSLCRLVSNRRWRHLDGWLLGAVKLALLATCIYAIYGLTKNGLTPTALYFRQTSSLLLAVPIGLDVGRVWGYRTVGIGFVASAALSIMVSLVEIAAPGPYCDAINAPNYMNLKYSKMDWSVKDSTKLAFFSSGQDLANANRPVWFNITGSESNDTSFRFMGTIIHPISYAYILAGGAIVGLSVGMGQWLWLILPLLLLIGVKGASLLVVCSLLLWSVWCITRSGAFLAVSALAMTVGYIAFGLWFGLQRGDLHVIGFMGGLKGLLADPIGHGLGSGGNLSTDGLQHVRWEAFQQFGAEFALESAVGVLIYQMGLASIAIFAVIAFLLREARFGAKGPERRDIIFLALGAVTVNGIFQEEAYAPYACGLFTLLCAVIVANGSRAAVTYARSRRRPPVFSSGGPLAPEPSASLRPAASR